MKKIISILFLLALINNSYSQRHKKKSRTKSITKKEIVTETVILDKNKPKIDSIKTKGLATSAVDIVEIIDTVIVPVGKFKPFKKNAHASYYASKFTGKRSASGRIFDNNKYMAAHKSFPFGTKLKVTNEKNNKSVYVEVVDRGPFVKGREIDLSRRAFMEIVGNKGSGAVIVSIEVLQK
ncbi:MAG: septal ring lytic transglycosylase RlpA family protein [Flavobacterium sp.]|nr:septal ring lytic transglycosylase RlpA family protein [Flavobacterium sp.]